MKSPLCYEVRSYEFPLRIGAISLFSSTTFANACIVYVGRAGRRIPSAHGNRSLFLLSIFITLLLFLCWGRERNSLFAQGRFHYSLLLRLPMPVLFMLGRAGQRIPSAHGNRSLFLLSTFITLLLFLCGEERTSSDLLPSVTHCSLPRAYNYCRMQEESHSLRRRNSSDLPPPPRIAPCREFTITIEYKKAMMMCVAGIRQT